MTTPLTELDPPRAERAPANRPQEADQSIRPIPPAARAPEWLETAMREDKALARLGEACGRAGYEVFVGPIAHGARNGPQRFYLEARPPADRRGGDEMPLGAVFQDARSLAASVKQLAPQIELIASERADASRPRAKKQSRGDAGPKPANPERAKAPGAAAVEPQKPPSSADSIGRAAAAAFDVAHILAQPYVETLSSLCDKLGYELRVQELSRRTPPPSGKREFALAAIPKRGGVADGRSPEQPGLFSDAKGLRVAVRSVSAGLGQAHKEIQEAQQARAAKAASAKARAHAALPAAPERKPRSAALVFAPPMPSFPGLRRGS